MQTIKEEILSHVKPGGKPDEVREFEKGKVEVYKLGGSTLGKATFQPGWKWSECVKPIAGTDVCECPHTGYQISGKMHIVPRDGAPYVINAGDSFYIPPGHDGWVIGEEPVVCLDFTGMAEYAKPSEGKKPAGNRADQRRRKH